MKEKKQALVPEVRFPEFSGDWEEKTLGEVFTRTTKRNIENNQNILTISAQYGLVSQTEFFNKSVASADVTGYYLLEKGDFAYNKSSSAGFPMGVIKPLKYYEKGVVSTLYICFRCNDPESVNFWEQYFNAGCLDPEIRTIAQEGARNHGLLNVPTTDFFQLKVLVPPPPEQKKIAECLSSLDESIKAEDERLQSLKDHKKGLMQKLFPKKGKTIPEVRFPGFNRPYEWKGVGEVCTTFSGGTPKSGNNDYYGGDIPFIKSGEIHQNITAQFLTQLGLDNSSAKMVEVGDVLYALYGANSGDVAISKVKGAINQAVLCIRSNTVNTRFMAYFLECRKDEIVSKYIQGGQGNLSGEIVCSINVPITSLDEQQKIADCLSSLDDEIAAQQQKVDALKEHKKGLMQKMFPKVSNN